MFKKAIIFICLILTSTSSNAYTLEWANLCPGNSDFYPQDNVADVAGNVYNTGRYVGTVDLDPSAGVSSFTASGFTDAFIQKLDPAGNFLWVITFTGGSWEVFNSLCLDAVGNIYAFGHFGGTVDFDPGPGVFNLISSGGNDFVIAKFSPAGNLIWAKAIGGVSGEESVSVGSDALGNVYCCGTFGLSVDFDPGPGVSTYTSVGGADVCVFKLDAAGNFLWAASCGTNTSESIGGMDVENTGNIIITGSFSGTGDFNPNVGVSSLTAVAFSDIFFLKLNALGNYVWSSSIGSAGFDFSNDVCFSNGGEILIVGGFNNTIDFDPGPGSNILTAVGYNGFLLNLTSAGTFSWVRHFIGFSLIPSIIEVNQSGKIFITGAYKNTADFDPGPSVVTGTASNTLEDAFVLRLDINGFFESVLDPEGTVNFEQIMAMTISASGDAYFMGRLITGTIDLLMGPGIMSITNSTPASGNGFFFKLNAGSPLPVEWGSIAANPKSNSVELKWTTLSEKENDYFEIQRSYNGIEWEYVGKEKGNGNSNYRIDYQLIDFSPNNGIIYYRIRQVDFNGLSSLSKTVATQFLKDDQNLVKVAISEGANSIILWSNEEIESVKIAFYTSTGKLLKELNNYKTPIEIDVSLLPSQLLYIRVSYNEKATTFQHLRL
jgi:hypothetical protein